MELDRKLRRIRDEDMIVYIKEILRLELEGHWLVLRREWRLV